MPDIAQCAQPRRAQAPPCHTVAAPQEHAQSQGPHCARQQSQHTSPASSTTCTQCARLQLGQRRPRCHRRCFCCCCCACHGCRCCYQCRCRCHDDVGCHCWCW